MLSFQSSGIKTAKLDTPEPDGFSTDGDASFSEQVFDEWSGTPAMTEIEAIVEPDGVGNDIGWGAPSRNR